MAESSTAQKHFFSNRQIAALFEEISAVYDILGESFFRRRAYDTAAVSIAQNATSLYELWQQKNLAAVAGLGETFESYLDELFSTGKIEHFEQMKRKVPAGVFPLLPLNGIGPKTAFRLAQEFSLDDAETTLQKVKELAEAHKIQEMEGFGPDKEQRILTTVLGALENTTATERMLLPEAEALAKEVIVYLQESPAVLSAEALGSVRRHAPTVGDVDIAVQTNDPEAVMSHVQAFPNIVRLLSTGVKTTMFVHTSGHQVDVKTTPPESWGSMLQHYTGSKVHNIHLRQRALQKGMSLSEHGIKIDGIVQPIPTEEEFYKRLDLQYVPPELREGGAEIGLAAKNALPKLVSLSDLKGDLHVHTDIDVLTSHDQGRSSVAELLTVAHELKYEYLGFADHNPRSTNVSLSKKRSILRERREKIEAAGEQFRQQHGAVAPHVLVGLEVDIRADGSLALEDELLDELDYAIVSVHSTFDQDVDTATARILKAFTHPKVRIWGHPTGRMIQERSGLEYHWPTLLEACLQKNIWVEVNSSPRRLDVPDELIPQITAAGVLLCVDSDSHQASTLRSQQYGIWNARRGGAEKKQVANTVGWEEFVRKVSPSRGK